MKTLEMQTFILQAVCIISTLILLLFIVIYIIKPWLQHCFVQRQKELDFEQKKEMEYQLLAMSKVKVENEEIDKLKMERDNLKKEIKELEKEIKVLPNSFNRTALIYKLLQMNSELTSEKIKKHQKEIGEIFENLDKIVNVK